MSHMVILVETQRPTAQVKESVNISTFTQVVQKWPSWKSIRKKDINKRKPADVPDTTKMKKQNCIQRIKANKTESQNALH